MSGTFFVCFLGIANGCFFNLGARLARYTGNTTYSDWAEKTWDWMEGVGFMDPETDNIYDGAHVDKNCTDINKAQFSYNNGVFLQGAAFMYNYVREPIPSCSKKANIFCRPMAVPNGREGSRSCSTTRWIHSSPRASP